MKRWLNRITLPITVAAAAALTGLAAPAIAAPPTPVSTEPIFFPCPNFTEPVRLDLTGKSKTVNLPGERQVIASPNLRVKVTAPNGNTATYLITGATHVTYLPNAQNPTRLEIKSTGLNLLLIPETLLHPAGLVLTTGNVNYAITPTGDEIRTFSGTGRTLDVCQALA